MKIWQVSSVATEAAHEAYAAAQKFEPFNSAHEGYAILLEEVDELWEVVRQKQSERDLAKLRKEAIQVAALALRFVTDVCDGEAKE
jgi:hypothetical protein